MRALVTGAGGFIGSHLTQALVSRGDQVRALVRYNGRDDWGHLEQIRRGCPSNLEVRMGNIEDPYLARSLVTECQVVFHLAALIGIPYSYHAPASYVAVNVLGALHILQACRDMDVERIIMTSTSEVYGSARYVPMDEAHPLQAQSPYAATKIAADKLADSYFASFDLPIVVLRPFNTYGPRQSARAIIPTVLSQALRGADVIRIGNPEPKRDLTFVEDTVQAFVLAGETSNIEGQTIHFGQGDAISVGDLALRCLEVVGSKSRIVSTTERQRPPKSEVQSLLCNPSKARELLGWEATVPLDEGLRSTATYIRTHPEQYLSDSYTL